MSVPVPARPQVGLLDRHHLARGRVEDGGARAHAARRLGHALRVVQYVLDRGRAARQVHDADADVNLDLDSLARGGGDCMGRRRLLATLSPSVRSQAGDWMVSTRETKQRS